MRQSLIESKFPNLSEINYKITSPYSKNYNCIAWVVGETDRWWWPDPYYQYYWPYNIPRTNTLDCFIKAFTTLGYKISTTEKYEKGFEKIALFAKNNLPTHAARQLESGHWTSKLGPQEDIEHFDLKSIEGQDYGKVTVILKRRKNITTYYS
ncbi:MAG: hypothetical protein KAW92_07605 [Candidatus Cloacimonetes bacterium]|nr:hypothetical protein [Candidatus Cloacimonadota bacterium]